MKPSSNLSVLSSEKKGLTSGRKSNSLQPEDSNQFKLPKSNLQFDENEKISLEDLNLQLDYNMNDIISLLGRRRHLIEIKKKKIREQYQKKMDFIKKGRSNEIISQLKTNADKELTSMLSNLQNYSKLKGLINNIWNQNVGNLSKTENTKTLEFWNINKKMENEIDQSLKKLKALDLQIDKIVNDQFETCTKIDELQESIRDILRKKEDNHIKKAEPFSIEKQKLLESLQTKQHDREKAKDDKRQIIRKIMTLLEGLRNHREQRINGIDSLFIGGFDLNTYQNYLDTIQRISKSKENVSSYDNEQQKIKNSLQNIANKTEEITNLLIQKQSEQAKGFTQLNFSYKNRIKLFTMEKLFITDTVPQTALKNIPEFIKKCKQYKKILEASVQQQNLVRQGLEKTRQTTDIFDQILKTIESERNRRQKLLQHLEQIQQYHKKHHQQQNSRRQLVVQIQNLKNKKRQYEKYLTQLAAQADLVGYKKTTNDISDIQNEISTKQQKADGLGQQLIQNEQQLIRFTNHVKNDFNDILKQVVPNSWMKNHDLKKFENISELNMYLKKTFKRLNLS